MRNVLKNFRRKRNIYKLRLMGVFAKTSRWFAHRKNFILITDQSTFLKTKCSLSLIAYSPAWLKKEWPRRHGSWDESARFHFRWIILHRKTSYSKKSQINPKKNSLQFCTLSSTTMSTRSFPLIWVIGVPIDRSWVAHS